MQLGQKSQRATKHLNANNNGLTAACSAGNTSQKFSTKQKKSGLVSHFQKNYHTWGSTKRTITRVIKKINKNHEKRLVIKPHIQLGKNVLLFQVLLNSRHTPPSGSLMDNTFYASHNTQVTRKACMDLRSYDKKRGHAQLLGGRWACRGCRWTE